MFTDEERAYLLEMRAITSDSRGREHFVGLTLEESAEYLGFSRDLSRSYDGNRYLALYEKHEAARRAVLWAENELRVDQPTKQ